MTDRNVQPDQQEEHQDHPHSLHGEDYMMVWATCEWCDVVLDQAGDCPNPACEPPEDA